MLLLPLFTTALTGECPAGIGGDPCVCIGDCVGEGCVTPTTFSASDLSAGLRLCDGCRCIPHCFPGARAGEGALQTHSNRTIFNTTYNGGTPAVWRACWCQAGETCAGSACRIADALASPLQSPAPQMYWASDECIDCRCIVEAVPSSPWGCTWRNGAGYGVHVGLVYSLGECEALARREPEATGATFSAVGPYPRLCHADFWSDIRPSEGSRTCVFGDQRMCFEAYRPDHPSCTDYEGHGHSCVGDYCATTRPLGLEDSFCWERGSSPILALLVDCPQSIVDPLRSGTVARRFPLRYSSSSIMVRVMPQVCQGPWLIR